MCLRVSSCYSHYSEGAGHTTVAFFFLCLLHMFSLLRMPFLPSVIMPMYWLNSFLSCQFCVSFYSIFVGTANLTVINYTVFSNMSVFPARLWTPGRQKQDLFKLSITRTQHSGWHAGVADWVNEWESTYQMLEIFKLINYVL